MHIYIPSLCVLWWLLLLNITSGIQTEQVYTVGAVLPLTGNLQGTGAIYYWAYQLLFQLLNDANTSNFTSSSLSPSPFNSYELANVTLPTFKLTILDDESDPTYSAEQIKKLVSEYDVDAILGGYSSQIVEAQAQAANNLGVPYVNGGGAASTIYTANRSWVFGVMAATKVLSTTTMTMLKDLVFRSLLPKPCKLVVIYENSPHGLDFLSGVTTFQNKTENSGFFVISATSSFIYSNQPSWDAEQTAEFAVNAYGQFSADVLLIDAHLEQFISIQKSFQQKMSNVHYKLISYGARGGEIEAQNALGKDLTGLFYGTWWSVNFVNAQSLLFKAIWQNSTNSNLPLDYRAACAYEAARALASAVISSVNYTKEDVKESLALLYLKDSLFLNEELRFNSFGQAGYDFAFEQVNYASNRFGTKFIYPISIKEIDPTIFYYSKPGSSKSNAIPFWAFVAVGAGGLLILLLAVVALYRTFLTRDISYSPKKDLEHAQRGKKIPKKRKLPPGSRLVTKEEFPLILSNWNIDLGLSGSQCPVDKEIAQVITVINKSHSPVFFQFVLPEKTHKAEVLFNPMMGKIGKKQTIEVTVMVKFFCTARWVAQPLITASKQKQGGTKMHCPLEIKLDSMLSTKLSYDEVTTKGSSIGEGSFGTVYEGEWRGFPVAVKMLKVQEGVAYTEGLLQELQNEVEIMSTLRHPNIVNFIGASIVPGHLFLVTEFMPMGNLGQYLNPKNNIRLMLKVKIALDCARGMDFLHKCNILHRDLKPDNLLVVSMSRSSPTNVKLTDFGTARAVTLTITKATQMTVGLGTPIYMAPEVMLGDYDQKSDVFSFAILLYELCTQTTPYSRFSRSHKVAQFVSSGKRLEIPATVPPFFHTMITRCWAENAADRPSFAELVEELENVYSRRSQDISFTEDHSEKESRKNLKVELSLHKKPEPIEPLALEAAFSSPTSPAVEMVQMTDGTTTSSTFSNLITFSAGSNSTASETTMPQSSSRGELTKEKGEDDFVVCQVCHSKTSSATSSKSSAGGEHTHPPSVPLTIEDFISNLEGTLAPATVSKQRKMTREESERRIEKVMEALAAGTIHEAIPSKPSESKEVKEKENEKGGEPAEFPRGLNQQHSKGTIDMENIASEIAGAP